VGVGGFLSSSAFGGAALEENRQNAENGRGAIKIAQGSEAVLVLEIRLGGGWITRASNYKGSGRVVYSFGVLCGVAMDIRPTVVSGF